MEREDRSTLVRICDPAGRTRGTGFVADDRGTVVTGHEAVDGLLGVVVHAPGGRSCAAGADAITPLPECGLALVGTEGLGVRPLPIGERPDIEPGTYVRFAAQGWREARVLGDARVTYTATDRFHLLDDVLELAVGTAGSEALRLGGEAAGGPVLDAASGAVLAVLGTALHAGHRAAGFAVPLARTAAADPEGPLGRLLRRNAASVPVHGPRLNLAGALELTATTAPPADPAGTRPAPVERAETGREFALFEDCGAPVLALVGDPGTGRTTELAAFAARRARGGEPAPTLWLRGADLWADDASVADAAGRALRRAGRVVTGAGAPGDMAYATAERVARLARAAGRPLVVLLDGPEERPPVPAHRLSEWTTGTVGWLRTHGARLVLACGPEHWEQAGALFPEGALYRPARAARRLPAALTIGDLAADEARRAREAYGHADLSVAAADARHPLALRLLAEVREALPGAVPGRPGREEVFAAHLDLMCLRIAVRIAAASHPPVRGTAVRRLAAAVAGRVHDAARHCLGPGQGELAREVFEELFPWGPGWASAVLAEGLLVPAGAGYRFAHEEVADWVQGGHLDLDAALRLLVHRPPSRPRPAGSAPGASRTRPRPRYGPPPLPVAGTVARRSTDAAAGTAACSGPASEADHARALPVPRHRVGPVVQALLRLGRVHGPAALSRRLERLAGALDGPEAAVTGAPPRSAAPGAGAQAERRDQEGTELADEALWWSARLLSRVLLRVEDARPYLGVLRGLAERIADPRARTAPPGHRTVRAEFGPWFWEGLALGEDERMDLLRRLVPADGPPGTHDDGARYLDTVARRLALDPRGVQPLLCRWFGDERPLPAEPGARVRPTVAGVAQALLYARRDLAVDDLCEALVATAHPRAGKLLASLAEDEPAALCRAVDRWAHDDTRPGRRAAAAACGRLVALHVTTAADRELLRYAALALLARPADQALHGPALGLLVRDPRTRSRYLPQALAMFRSGGPGPAADALAAALGTHPEPVLDAFRTRLREPDDGAAEVLRALADVHAPAISRRVCALIRDYVGRHPEGAVHAARYVDLRLEHGPGARAVLLPLVTALVRDGSVRVRSPLATVLAAPGPAVSALLRAELLEVLLEHEQHACRDIAVLDAVLRAAALGAGERPDSRTRQLVHRVGLLLARTPEGAARFDQALVELAREVPGFAVLVADWVAGAPREWARAAGPGARRTVASLAALARPARVPRPATAPPSGGQGPVRGAGTEWTAGSGPGRDQGAEPVPLPGPVPSPMPMRAASRGHGSLRPA
ncbi:trypsin-like peptidase domain-containing protein [Streptomyces sp. SP18CS02]|uniref:trypsin-like peptidase domain-containing protein n=1 Tax=Streptomyces sp. SP18CS02 TaxID=3002531 RepID=UPI002E7A2183|nr:trypsin-like peptidase domain-containing protein [Streptomyces sp. SP18CS02]MEE1756871.1 serine protease [Streptomyces sp. SP18CS02]